MIARFAPEAAELPFMGVAAVALAGVSCLVSRSGYTGEDGFEISLPADNAPAIAQRILTSPRSSPPASAPAIRCGWRQGFASTATTSMN